MLALFGNFYVKAYFQAKSARDKRKAAPASGAAPAVAATPASPVRSKKAD
jgi:hypothetical protein